jgi:hypothetical protein
VSHGLVVETKVATWAAERCTDLGTEGGFAQPDAYSRSPPTAATNSATTDKTRGEAVMTSKSDFPDDEWPRVIRAPLVAGMAIMLADPGGPIEATKETMASIRTATNPPTREQLVTEVALDVQTEVQAKRNPLKGFRPDGTSSPGDQVLAELTAVQEIVAARATDEEAAAFGRWLVAAAQAAADAAKEGGFMGIGAQRVSEREQEMLARVRKAVSG